MKIYTITTYDVYNYGASLQAYALQQYLKHQGHDATIIRYQPDYLSRKYDYKWVNPESKMSHYAVTRVVYRIAKFIQRQMTMGRKHAFDEFNHGVLKETPVCYRTFDELKVIPPEADLYLCGSDQIWNVFYDAGRDPAFYLEFAPKGSQRASYAASFSYLDIDRENSERIAASLQKFEGISVREYHGLEILKGMGIEGTWVLDPVFLLPVEHWRTFAQKGNLEQDCHREPYLLIYDFEGNDLLKEAAIAYARQHHLKIYAIVDTYPLRYADRNFKKAGPIEFVQMIEGCSAFMSNSFHGTAFSIMLHKPLFVFKRNRHSVNSRMESLLTLFELKDCMIDGMSGMLAALSKDFDWDKIEGVKEKQLAVSVNYLKKLGV